MTIGRLWTVADRVLRDLAHRFDSQERKPAAAGPDASVQFTCAPAKLQVRLSAHVSAVTMVQHQHIVVAQLHSRSLPCAFPVEPLGQPARVLLRSQV